jgi:hypothetical protein
MINFEPNVTRSTFNGYKNSYFTKYFIEEPKQVYKSNKVKTAVKGSSLRDFLYSIYETMYRANINEKMGKDVQGVIKEYDELWKKWILLKENHACCPTLFQKNIANISWDILAMVLTTLWAL